MKPGRELDALVAEALGWKRTDERPPDYHNWTNYPDVWYRTPNGTIENVTNIPPYSTDIAAAWQMDRPGWTWEFQETSHDLTATLYPSPEARSEALASYPILPEGVTLVRREWGDDKAGTYAWVRCLAALRAVGVEVGDA
jgi:hypothetical protein